MAVTGTSQGARADELSALVVLVDALIDRAQRSPLMRRAPAQCTPEEQLALAGVLADLAALRTLRSAVETLPMLRIDQISTHWPELGSLLGTARRGGTPSKTRIRDGQSSATQNALFERSLAADVDGNAPEEPEPIAEEPAVASVGPTGESNESQGSAAPDMLKALLLEALTVQGRALNTTQMLAWLRERGTTVNREQIMNTLFSHEELFQRRGAGHWIIASKE